MADAIVWNVLAKALETLGKSAFKEAASWWGARDELKKLENSMNMIQARVNDAERRQEEENSDTIKAWLRKLRLLLYRADDLFDKVCTHDHQIKRCDFFSKIKLAHEIKSIRKELDGIKLDMAGLNLNILPAQELRPMVRQMKERETASFVKAEDVIGRENDFVMIIEMLFDPKYDNKKVTVIPIVGFGGLGKTTLAQLIFNDDSVQKHFDMVSWVCTPEVGNQRAVMEKVHRSFTGESSRDLSMDEIKSGIRRSIGSKKFFLVLDDIWDESRNRWLDLLSLLECGEVGSKIIVTTRSNEVAKIVGTIPEPHKLRLLTKEESWDLFRRLAFKSGQESNPTFIQIGQEIVGSCGNVPLAIRVVGSLLYSKDGEEEWELFKDHQLSKAKLTEDNNIMPVLKLSYDHLPSALKQCFAYCSIFPKNYEYNKFDLVQLWMAQGYFEPSNRDLGGQYFLFLLGRNFFQDAQEDDRGNVQTCKMHDLVHDLAQLIAGDESLSLGESSMQITNNELVHVNLNEQEAPSKLLVAKKMRSLLGLSITNSANLETVIARLRSLRVLSLENSGIERLPNSIGRLIHLRYLNLAGSPIKCLPDSIAKLKNLQTLSLDDCKNLKKLPLLFASLTNLRHLVIDWDSLTELPSEFGKMTSLQELRRFEVGKLQNSGIDSLPALNLRGDLMIKFHKWNTNAAMEAHQATLNNNDQLVFLSLKFQVEGEMDEMLKCLQLPPHLKYLEFDGYKGVEMPRKWFDKLSKLVSVSITWCDKCKVLPHLIQLRQLRFLYLKGLEALEYIEDEVKHWPNGGGEKSGYTTHEYLPFLEVLELVDLPEVRGWARPTNDNGEQRQLLFPCLQQMKVIGCQKLKAMPLAPKLESLEVRRINGKLLKSSLTLLNDQEASSSSATPLFLSLKQLKIYQIEEEMEFLSISNRMCNLNTLEISFCYQLKSLMFESPNYIRRLDIKWCHNLRNISEGLKHLSALERLEIRCCRELKDEEEEGRTTSAWQALKSLRFLQLLELPKLTKLPRGIFGITTLQFLTISILKELTVIQEEIGNLSQLRELQISHCPKLASLPPSLQGITSLQKLYIGGCSSLAQRYKKPNGEDCHIIQHIPHVEIEA